jgi:pimeloyl-ACP methyl ester carboxylesterase
MNNQVDNICAVGAGHYNNCGSQNIFKQVPWLVFFLLLVFFAGCSLDDDDDLSPQQFNSNPVQTTQIDPYFEYVTCQQYPADEIPLSVECGYLNVPEDRSEPETNTIQVYVSIYQPTELDPNAIPTIFLNGGPGATNADYYGIFYNNEYVKNSIAKNAPIILLAQRGTNYSEPALYCSKMGDYRETVYSQTWEEQGEGRVPLLLECYDEWTSQGIDINGYDTLENAADIKDLVTVLNYEKVNIVAGSYGTRLAIITMKNYPEIVRSAVLDSVLPPETNPFLKLGQGTMEGINALFAAAKTDYPDLERYFYGLITRLQNNYIYATTSLGDYTVEITAPKLVDYIAISLRGTPYNEKLPYNIYDMYFNENYVYLADRWISTVNYNYPAGEAGSQASAFGFFQSVFAANDTYYTTPEEIESAVQEATDNEIIREYLRQVMLYKEPATLHQWEVEPLLADIREPLVSDIPILMLVGQLDTATATLFSRDSMQYLSNSFYFVVPAGHGTLALPCALQMAAEFLADPYVEPENNCSTAYEWEPWNQ